MQGFQSRKPYFIHNSAFMKRPFFIPTVVFILLVFSGCKTLYQSSIEFQNSFASGNYEQALKKLENNRKYKSDKNELLYFLNKGVLLHMQGNYEESNEFFLKADYYIEDYRKKLGNEALTLISNPGIKPYRAEDFESVLFHYYSALNYINMNDYESALVECRRINIRLNELNDQYKDHKNRYQRDAFAHVLMGLIYEASGDYNNAFIAYRNGIDVYEEDYKENFGIGVPEQLKYDVIRAAEKSFLTSEKYFYQDKFNIDSIPSIQENEGELVFFWLNGLGPVKEEWSINFTNAGVENGYINLVNQDMGLNYPLYVGDYSNDKKSALKNLSFYRIAFPKYTERQPYYNSAYLNFQGKTNDIEIAEDINQIAFKTLRDRMLREISNSLLRLVVKKAMEHAAREEDETLGAIISLVNAATEKADTRNWQTLPYSIGYTRMNMPEGSHTVTLALQNQYGLAHKQFNVDIQKGKINFKSFHTLSTK